MTRARRLSSVLPRLIVLAAGTAACASEGSDTSGGVDSVGVDGRAGSPIREAGAPSAGHDGSTSGGPTGDASLVDGDSDATVMPTADATHPPSPPWVDASALDAIRRCLPPCIYDALVDCAVPGAGAPPLDPATCVSVQVSYPGGSNPHSAGLTCDLTSDFIRLRTEGYYIAYRNQEPCVSRFVPSNFNSAMDRWVTGSVPWADWGAGRIAMVTIDLSVDFPRTRAYCGDPADPATVSYEMDLSTPECALAKKLYEFDFWQDCPQEGQCPWTPPYPL